jgi:hypothetical protein
MSRKRPILLTGALAIIMSTGLALVACARPGPAGPAPGQDWTGGLVSPAPVQVTVNPSAMPVGDAIATGLVAQGQELILMFWGYPERPDVGMDWRDVETGGISKDSPFHTASHGWGFGTGGSDRMFVVDQIDLGDGTVIEYGAVSGSAARIVCQPPDSALVEAKFARWSLDPSVSFFWLRRRGTPIPTNSPSGHDGLMVPLAPDRYPVFTAYDRAGKAIGSVRLRPEAYGPRNDG